MSGAVVNPTSVLLPGQHLSGQQTTLGVMGGGQLGRMFVQAAQEMGYFTVVLDPDPTSPAGLVSHFHIETDYLDEQGLAQLMQRAVAITTEFENVPAPALYTLGGHRTVAPSAKAVAIAQDRVLEKTHFANCGVPCAPFAVIETLEQLASVPGHLLPGILKTTRMGYDGKGQVVVTTPEELAAAWQKLKQVPCVLEQRLPLALECSVIVARAHNGTIVNLPVQKNLHRAGILAVTEVYEGVLPSALAEAAIAAAKSIAVGLDYVGVLCIEFFVLQADSPEAAQLGSLVVNEMAPRPHNSGHYSMNACDVSQFGLQVRTLAGLPLVQPRQHSAAIMLNLLGDLWQKPAGSAVAGASITQTPDWSGVLALPGAHLHLYGKLDARPGRKMGHLTLTGVSAAEVKATALKACALLGIAPF
jgi:5-(carboxyamino)imidazole ribonucleotide synthase